MNLINELKIYSSTLTKNKISLRIKSNKLYLYLEINMRIAFCYQ